MPTAQAPPRPSVPQHVRRPGPFPAGRACPESGCLTILNRWNPGPRCFKCTLPEPRQYGRIPLDEMDAMRDLMESV